MKLRELISVLMRYNMEAEVKVMNGFDQSPFTVTATIPTDGGTAANASEIFFYVPDNDIEQAYEDQAPTTCNVEELIEQPAVPEAQPQHDRAARVGGNVTSGKGNWFSGTTWG